MTVLTRLDVLPLLRIIHTLLAATSSGVDDGEAEHPLREEELCEGAEVGSALLGILKQLHNIQHLQNTNQM